MKDSKFRFMPVPAQPKSLRDKTSTDNEPPYGLTSDPFCHPSFREPEGDECRDTTDNIHMFEGVLEPTGLDIPQVDRIVTTGKEET